MPTAASSFDAAQATRLALEVEQTLLGKPHAPRLPDARDTSSIQDQLLAVVSAAGMPISVAAVHQALAAELSLAQVRDNLVIMARNGKLLRKERGIYAVP